MVTAGTLALTAALLLPFVVTVIATSTRTLWLYSLMAFLPAIVLGGLMFVPGGERAFPLFVGFFASAILGTLARRASLIARGYGHWRPWSFWIEGVFLVLTVGFLWAAGL